MVCVCVWVCASMHICVCMYVLTYMCGALAVYASLSYEHSSLGCSKQLGIVQSLCPSTESVTVPSFSCTPTSIARSELDLTKEQLAHQHARVLSLQQRGAGEEEVCQERLAEQQLRLKQVCVWGETWHVCASVRT